jgi:hypothetical protein
MVMLHVPVTGTGTEHIVQVITGRQGVNVIK